MFAAYGSLRFEVLSSPTSFSESRRYGFAEHPIVEGRPVLQKVGEELRSIHNTFRFHKGFCDPKASLESLRDLAEEQEPNTYILGDGTVEGEYVIEEIESTVEMLDKAGAAVWIDVTVRFREVAPEQVITVMRKVRKKPTPQPGRKTKSVPEPTSKLQYDYKDNALILAKKGDFSGMRW